MTNGSGGEGAKRDAGREKRVSGRGQHDAEILPVARPSCDHTSTTTANNTRTGRSDGIEDFARRRVSRRVPKATATRMMQPESANAAMRSTRRGNTGFGCEPSSTAGIRRNAFHLRITIRVHRTLIANRSNAPKGSENAAELANPQPTRARNPSNSQNVRNPKWKQQSHERTVCATNHPFESLTDDGLPDRPRVRRNIPHASRPSSPANATCNDQASSVRTATVIGMTGLAKGLGLAILTKSQKYPKPVSRSIRRPRSILPAHPRMIGAMTRILRWDLAPARGLRSARQAAGLLPWVRRGDVRPTGSPTVQLHGPASAAVKRQRD